MVRLRQIFGAHTGRILESDADVIRFGRMPDNDVAFDPTADLDASGRHAEIRRRGGGYFVLDTQSRNGTWLNGVRVSEARLSDGDEIEFGPGGPRIVVELGEGRGKTGPMTPTPPKRPDAPAPVGLAAHANTMLANGEDPRGPFASPPGVVPPFSASARSPGPFAAGGAPFSAPSGGVKPAPFGSAAVAGGGAPPAAGPGPFGVDRSPDLTPFGSSAGAAKAVPMAPPPVAAARSAAAPFPLGQNPAPAAPSPYAGRANPFADASPFFAAGANRQSPQPYAPPPASAPLRNTPEVRADSDPNARKFGQRTVGMMIHAAVQQSESRTRKAGSLWFALGCVTAALILTAVGFAIYAYATRDESPEVRDSGGQLPTPTLEPAPSASALVERFGGAVFLVAQENAGERVCHAFAIRPNLLGTTRECIDKIEHLRRRGAAAHAFPYRGGSAVQLGQSWTDPEGGVGLVELRTQAPVVIPVASDADLSRLALGEPIFVLSFPQAPPGQTPQLMLGSGAISRFLGPDERLTEASNTVEIEHSAPGGTGAPVLTNAGTAIGIQLPDERSAAGPPSALRADRLNQLATRIGR